VLDRPGAFTLATRGLQPGRTALADKPADPAQPADAEPAAADAPPAEPAEPGAAAAAADGAAEEESPPEADANAARIAELEDQLKQKQDQVLRALAEAENARRRAAIDVENAHKFAVSKFSKDLLEVADNLGRAANSVPEELRTSDETPALKALYEGVIMVDDGLHKTFEKHGLKRIDPLGEKFDPNLHNAMFEAPDPEKEPGTVMHVASPGYVMHERVVRPAGVGVVSAPP